MKIIQCQQGTQEWLDCRAGRATASEFHKIITPKTGKLSAQADAYISALIAERIEGVDEDEADLFMSKAMRNGRNMEPKARKAYEFEKGVEVQQVGFIISDDDNIGCSPDGLVGDDGGVEIKYPTLAKHIAYVRQGGLPDQYKPQVHGSLAVTGRAWWDFMSFAEWGLPPHIVRVEPDEYTERLADALGEFSERLEAAIKPFLPYIEEPVPQDLEEVF